MSFECHAYGLSDIGLVRSNNEDVWLCLPEFRYFILADGMGGHQAGEVAAREATQFLQVRFQNLLNANVLDEYSIVSIADLIRINLIETNRFVYELACTHELLKGMGTTICCLYVHKDIAFFGHIGDSRIYRLRNNHLEQMTNDHSLLQQMLDAGHIQCKREQNYKNVITRAIGTDPYVEPAVRYAEVRENDLFLLCSDGLTDLVSNSEIECIMQKPLTIEERVRSLVVEAKKKGGFDNITVILVQVLKENAEEKKLQGRYAQKNLPRQ